MPSLIRAPSPVRRPCNSRVRHPRLSTASLIGMLRGIARRASLVLRRIEGIATTSCTEGSQPQRKTRQLGEEVRAVRQRPPSREGTTLSGWPSNSIASSSSFSVPSGSPARAFAPIKPATMAVALLPSPRAGGTASRTRASRPTGSSSASRHTRWAARYMRLSGPPRR